MMGTRLRTALVFVLAIALFSWFLHGADLTAVAGQIRRARGDLLLLSFVPLALTYLARTVRWQYLLEPIGAARFSSAFRATVIGFAAIALLPARIGDVLRPYLLARREGFSATSTFATIVMERVLDLVTVLALLALYVLVLGGRETLPARLLGPVEASATMAAAGACLLLAAAWTLATHPERIARLVLKSERVLPGRMAHVLSTLAGTFSQGLAVAREARALTFAFAWSVPVWIGIAAHAWLVTVAFGIAMPFAGTFLLQTLLVVGVAMPTPGAVGGYHAMYRLGVTSFFGASNDAAVGAAIVAHATSFVPVVIVGLVFMVQDGLSLSGLQQLAGAARREEGAVR
ncbi:MAG: lysylphosphatidylglycerol synthase transmembrane domain-containing protein [Vicinamibacterales bacterium]